MYAVHEITVVVCYKHRVIDVIYEYNRIINEIYKNTLDLIDDNGKSFISEEVVFKILSYMYDFSLIFLNKIK